jgi:hypothetical protein
MDSSNQSLERSSRSLDITSEPLTMKWQNDSELKASTGKSTGAATQKSSTSKLVDDFLTTSKNEYDPDAVLRRAVEGSDASHVDAFLKSIGGSDGTEISINKFLQADNAFTDPESNTTGSFNFSSDDADIVAILASHGIPIDALSNPLSQTLAADGKSKQHQQLQSPTASILPSALSSQNLVMGKPYAHPHSDPCASQHPAPPRPCPHGASIAANIEAMERTQATRAAERLRESMTTAQRERQSLLREMRTWKQKAETASADALRRKEELDELQAASARAAEEQAVQSSRWEQRALAAERDAAALTQTVSDTHRVLAAAPALRTHALQTETPALASAAAEALDALAGELAGLKRALHDETVARQAAETALAAANDKLAVFEAAQADCEEARAETRMGYPARTPAADMIRDLYNRLCDRESELEAVKGAAEETRLSMVQQHEDARQATAQHHAETVEAMAVAHADALASQTAQHADEVARLSARVEDLSTSAQTASRVREQAAALQAELDEARELSADATERAVAMMARQRSARDRGRVLCAWKAAMMRKKQQQERAIHTEVVSRLQDQCLAVRAREAELRTALVARSHLQSWRAQAAVKTQAKQRLAQALMSGCRARSLRVLTVWNNRAQLALACDTERGALAGAEEEASAAMAAAEAQLQLNAEEVERQVAAAREKLEEELSAAREAIEADRDAQRREAAIEREEMLEQIAHAAEEGRVRIEEEAAALEREREEMEAMRVAGEEEAQQVLKNAVELFTRFRVKSQKMRLLEGWRVLAARGQELRAKRQAEVDGDAVAEACEREVARLRGVLEQLQRQADDAQQQHGSSRSANDELAQRCTALASTNAELTAAVEAAKAELAAKLAEAAAAAEATKAELAAKVAEASAAHQSHAERSAAELARLQEAREDERSRLLEELRGERAATKAEVEKAVAVAVDALRTRHAEEARVLELRVRAEEQAEFSKRGGDDSARAAESERQRFEAQLLELRQKWDSATDARVRECEERVRDECARKLSESERTWSLRVAEAVEREKATAAEALRVANELATARQMRDQAEALAAQLQRERQAIDGAREAVERDRGKVAEEARAAADRIAAEFASKEEEIRQVKARMHEQVLQDEQARRDREAALAQSRAEEARRAEELRVEAQRLEAERVRNLTAQESLLERQSSATMERERRETEARRRAEEEALLRRRREKEDAERAERKLRKKAEEEERERRRRADEERLEQQLQKLLAAKEDFLRGQTEAERKKKAEKEARRAAREQQREEQARLARLEAELAVLRSEREAATGKAAEEAMRADAVAEQLRQRERKARHEQRKRQKAEAAAALEREQALLRERDSLRRERERLSSTNTQLDISMSLHPHHLTQPKHCPARRVSVPVPSSTKLPAALAPVFPWDDAALG